MYALKDLCLFTLMDALLLLHRMTIYILCESELPLFSWLLLFSSRHYLEFVDKLSDNYSDKPLITNIIFDRKSSYLSILLEFFSSFSFFFFLLLLLFYSINNIHTQHQIFFPSFFFSKMSISMYTIIPSTYNCIYCC